MQTVRVIQYGVGAMGSNMVRLLQARPQAQLVGAIDRDPAKIGRDVGELAGLGKETGVRVRFPPQQVLDGVKADVALLATTAFLDEAFPQIMALLERRLSVVTICQELFFPLGVNSGKAREIDRQARRAGVAVTACGINPGFIMDIVPVLCSLPCWQIDRVSVQRVVDFSPYGPDEMRHIGAGLSERAFMEGVRRGEIGHIGLLETAAMVAHCLGLQIDELRQLKEPLLARRPRETRFVRVPAGGVCGFRQSVAGLKDGETILDFRMVGIVAPNQGEDGVELGDHARIEGTPSVDIRIKEEIAQKGGLGTAGVAVNLMPRVLSAPPGFRTMNELALPHVWTGKPAPPPIERIIPCDAPA